MAPGRQGGRWRVLVTRGAEGAGTLAAELERCGMEAVTISAIGVAPPTSFEALDAALGEIGSFGWLVFTSARGVESFARRAALEGVQLPGRLHVAVVGAATARAAEAAGMRVDLVPPQAVAESLAESLLERMQADGANGVHVLFPRAQEGRETLPEVLRDAGHQVSVVAVYRTVVPEGAAERLRALLADRATWPDAVTFTSASTVRNLSELLRGAGVSLPADVVRVSIGPITTAAMREAGWPADAEAENASVAALAESVRRALDRR